MTKSIQPAALRIAAIGLLAASTLLFAIGAAAEHAAGPPQASATTPASSEATGHVEGAGTEASEHHDSDSGAGESGPGGLDTEGLPAVTAAVLISFAVGIALWFWWRRPIVLVLALLFAAGFAVLDAREVVHQVGVAQPLLAILAGGVTTLHAVTAFPLVLLVRAAR